jgi:DMSO/TMAO reductase YedYZ heme-binding membrane subunit
MFMVLKRALAFFVPIILFAAAVSVASFSISYFDPLDLAIRLFALNGFIALSVAAMMSPFLKEITLFLKKPFIKIHHYFAAVGLLLVTLHPVAAVIQSLNPSLFLPDLDSPYLFLFYGGSVALIAVYVAFGAVLLRKKFVAYWRPFHALMYLALFFGVVHANLAGVDLENDFLMVIYDALFLAVVAAFVLKRWQFYRIRTKRKKLVSTPK